MRYIKMMAFTGLVTLAGCGESKTQIPTKQQEMPKTTPATGGGGGADTGASTSKAS